MAFPIMRVLPFVMKYVIPAVKDIGRVLAAGTYAFIKDRVDDVDILELSGLEKRARVYKDTKEYLDSQGVDAEMYASAAIYLLIEIAVVNLKKKQNKLVK